ncbi:MAG: TetR/AcrR family transcriptional regulator [Oscillospiraceae bacterium]|nr:TetR/AcrR family transcriptional regulator [Oscillospiraceae bacterium]
MPPKIKVTKEEIVQAAVRIVRESGAQALNARTVAAALNCSTQPVFSNFSSMEELRLAVVEKADLLCRDYISRETERGEYPAYKASGMAYIRFAKEEKELFKLLYMRDRTNEPGGKKSATDDQMTSVVHDATNLEGTQASLFHLAMWIYVHGIAVMFATGFLDLEWELVSKMLTDAYQGHRKQYGME